MATRLSSTPGRLRQRLQATCLLLPLAAALAFAAPVRLRAQATPADSAAILLKAADELAREGRGDAAAALLAYIRAHFGGTAAAEEAARRLATLPAPRAPGAAAGSTSGRTELTVWGTTYGIWAGLAVPGALGADGPGAFGVGLLVGGPVGFLAARSYARATDITEGEARAVTFGGSWGTWQGYGWAKLAGLLDRTSCPPPPPIPGGVAPPCSKDTSGRRVLTAMLLGGAAGIAGGAALGNNLGVTPGAATTVNLAALWGTGYGLGAAELAGARNGNQPLAFALVGGDAALLGAALASPRWRLSRERARLISVAGLAGALAGLGVDLIFRVEDNAAAGIAMGGGAIGLALGASATRTMAPEAAAAPGGRAPGAPGGALLRLDGGRLEPGVPTPTPLVRPGRAGRPGAAGVFVPVFQARF